MATTLENLAETAEGQNDNLDPTKTGSLPETDSPIATPNNTSSNPSSDTRHHTNILADTKDIPEIFKGINTSELESAEIRLASLFDTIQSSPANKNQPQLDSNQASETDGSNHSNTGNSDISEPLPGAGATIAALPVASIGVSNPAQSIGEISKTSVVSPLFHSPPSALSGSDSKDVIKTQDDASRIITGTSSTDILSGGNGDDAIYAMDGDDRIIASRGADILDGGDGFDTADYSASSEGIIINLQSGDNTGGDAEGDTLSDIEAIIGSNFDDMITGHQTLSDTLFGRAGDDELYGMGGKDFIEGGEGADFINGGEGDGDVAEYVSSSAGVTVSLQTGIGSGGDAEGDQLTGIEFLHGSLFDDVLEGNQLSNRLEGRTGNDVLSGLDGDDRLLGGYGADILNGGNGNDIADYHWSDTGISVDISTGIGLGGEAEGDQLISIEYVSGSDYNDALTGDDGVNRLWGMDGDDHLRGNDGNDRLDGGLGADILDGGQGTDIADYSNAGDGVALSLATGGVAGEAAGDRFISIETVYGSQFADGIAGDDNNNRLVGNDGNDILFGAGGIDYLIGGNGDDILTGGTGADVFIFDGNFGSDTITDMWTGSGRTDRIWFKNQGIDDWDDLQQHLSQNGDDVLIDLGSNAITLENTVLADLHSDDFIYG